jgi:hypothetical protein
MIAKAAIQLKNFVIRKMKKKLLAAIEQFHDLLPEVIDNVNSIPDRIREIDSITSCIETIMVEKYVYEPETFFSDFDPIINDDLMEVIYGCHCHLLECDGVLHEDRVEDDWYPLHVGIFHYITDSIYHLLDFYFEIQETGIPESYGKAIK